METVYVVYSQDQIDEHCHVFIAGVYDCEKEAEEAARVCGGWAVTCEFFRKSESESFEE